MITITGPKQRDLPIAKYEIEAQRPFVRIKGTEPFNIFVTTYTIIKPDPGDAGEAIVKEATLALTPDEAATFADQIQEAVAEATKITGAAAK